MVNKKNPLKKIRTDTHSGSLAYNRLDMQVSQAIHMAIELYNDSDFLFVLDHYDDITIFDNEFTPNMVSYYQLKSKDGIITIDSVVRSTWLPKLYTHLQDSAWEIKELGLITNCTLKISKSKDIPEQSFNGGKTEFSKMDSGTLAKIKKDIGKALKIPANEIDLSKFIHIRTTLTIAEHKNIAEQHLNNFLYEFYPNIKLDVVKTIFNTLVRLLTERQAYEQLAKDDNFETVRKYKGISKNDFKRVIDSAMIVCIPTLEEIAKWSGYQESEKNELLQAYSQVLIDEQKKIPLQRELFKKIDNYYIQNPKLDSETIWDYMKRVKVSLGSISPIYDDLYILVVLTSIMINHWSRD